MKPRSNREVLENTLRKPVPENINLLEQIATRYTQRQSTLKIKKNFSLGVSLAVVALVAALFFLPGTASAMRRLLGYIPGLGLVEPGNSLRVLANPVVVERDGVTVTVEKGTSDAERTILRVSVNGTNAEGGPYCTSPELWLSLKDGTSLKSTYEAGNISFDVTGSGYTNLYTFPTLPAGSNELTLEIPCLWRVSTPENWEIPLVFIPASENGVNQVIEFPAVTATEAPTAQQTAEPAYGISLKLDKAILLDDGYLVMGTMDWSDTSVEVSPFITAVDTNGQAVPMEDPGEAGVEPGLIPTQEGGALSATWVYKISGKEHAWPITLKLDADVSFKANTSFTFDPGPEPKSGMSWALDEVLSVNGYSLRLVSAKWMENIPGTALLIEMQSADPTVTGLHITDLPYHEVPRMCGGGGGFDPGIMGAVVVYCEPITTAPRTLTIDSITLRIPGPWQINWQP
ncbi:MAG: hypothetical protein AB9897_03175 [Anaerolineaceae bacterium]